MPSRQNTADIQEEEEDQEGEGAGSLGSPQLKPNLETLFDPGSVIAEGAVADGSPEPGVERFGSWELHESSLMLFHRQLKKRLMLAQLDSASKMMKVIVALSTQPAAAPQGGEAGWDIEHLIKAMDYASNKKFGKGLYHIASMVNDSARLDWVQGTMAPIDHPKSPAKGL